MRSETLQGASNLERLVIMAHLSGSGGSTASRVFEYYRWYTQEIAPTQIQNIGKLLASSSVQDALLRFPIRTLVLSGEEGMNLLIQNMEDLRNMQDGGLIKNLHVLMLVAKRQVLRDRYLRHTGVSALKHPLEAKGLGLSTEKAIDNEIERADKLPSLIKDLGVNCDTIDTSFLSEESLSHKIYDHIMPDRPKLIHQSDITAMRQMNERVCSFSGAPLTEIFLITGERGTGKEMIAKAIHTQTQEIMWPKDCKKDFHIIDCDHIRKIYLEALCSVRRGTLLFNGIERLEGNSDVTESLQRKLKTKTDGKNPEWNEMRIIATSSCSRQDLFRKRELREIVSLFRIFIDTVPLREQGVDEIGKYIQFILKEIEQRENFRVQLEKEAKDYLENHEWPENITQMRQVLERSVRNSWALKESEEKWEPQDRPTSVRIQNKWIPRDVKHSIFPKEPSDLFVVPEDYGEFKERKKQLELMLKERFVHKFEREFYEHELAKFEGDKIGLANHLQMSVQNLYRKISELGIKKPE